MAESTPEEELAYYKERIVPALAKFKSSLEWITTRIFDQFPADAASLAAFAAEEFVKNAGLDRRYMAPLREAVDLASKNVPDERLLPFRRGMAVVRNPDLLRDKPPSLAEFREGGVARKDTIKIIAVVAVDLQRRLKVPLPDALKKVVGHDPRAAKRLENFRDILHRTKHGAKRKLYDQILRDWGHKGRDLPLTVDICLDLYRELSGKKRKP
jgi:hypothetical protein